jgi:phosphocarrier protein FPr
MDIPEGENPSLGMRGVRLYTSNRAIITRQIRAILRAASGFEVNIMFPMIVRDEEVEICKTLLFNAHTQLEREKVSHKWPIETGIMIETPAAAVTAHALAKHSDFFSIGTNDLTQYAMAAERGNSRLSPLSDPLNPAVIRLIYQASLEGRKAGLRVGICGEIGSEPSAAALVIGLGISSISTVPEKIPFVKNAVSSSSFSESVHAALEVVSTAENTEDVKKIMNRKLMKN